MLVHLPGPDTTFADESFDPPRGEPAPRLLVLGQVPCVADFRWLEEVGRKLGRRPHQEIKFRDVRRVFEGTDLRLRRAILSGIGVAQIIVTDIRDQSYLPAWLRSIPREHLKGLGPAGWKALHFIDRCADEYGSGVASTDTSTYDGNRNLVEWVNGRGKTWSYTYDAFGRRTRSTNPLGHYSEYIYDKGGNQIELKRFEEAGATDVLMAHTKQSFDECNRVYKMERGLKGTSTWSFLATTLTLDKRGRTTVMTDPRGKDTSFTYDAAGRRTHSADALGNTIDYSHDDNDNVVHIEETETTGYSTTRTFTTELEYDALDRQVEERIISALSSSDVHTTTFRHDSLGILVERVDPEGNTTTWTHDGLGRVLEESIDLGSSTSKRRSWGYDKNDRLVSHKDDGNNETTWTYNARDLCIAETYADTGTKDFDYDSADNVTQWIDPNGTQVDLVYDDNNRNTSRDIARGSGVGGTTDEDYTYDALDRLTEAKDNDVTVQHTWDSLSRKKNEVSGPNPIVSSGKTTSYTYDDAGNVTRLDYPDGSFYVTRTIDDVNRTTLIEDGNSVDIVGVDFYGRGGGLKKFTFGNAMTTEHAFDGFRRLSDLDHKTSGGTLRTGYDVARDKIGNILYEEWGHDSGKGHNYSYDKAYRLKKTLQVCNDPSAEHASPGSQTYATKVEYNLNDDSDRTSVVTTPYGSSASTVSYTSNSVHEYTVVGGTNRSYDDNGNLTDDGTFTYSYDYRNQLLTVTRTSNSHVEGTYEYDALGRRTRKTVYGGASVRYYHDGRNEIEEYDGATLLRKFVYRHEIDSIAMMEAADVADVDNDSNTSELVRLFYHYDTRGNVARLTADAQAVVEAYESDPFGSVTIKDKNGSGVSTSQVGNPFLFQRRRRDDESGLMYFRARTYDPSSGQWMQRDPLGCAAGPNSREFCESNPATYADPTGLLSTGQRPINTGMSGNVFSSSASLITDAGGGGGGGSWMLGCQEGKHPEFAGEPDWGVRHGDLLDLYYNWHEITEIDITVTPGSGGNGKAEADKAAAGAGMERRPEGSRMETDPPYACNQSDGEAQITYCFEFRWKVKAGNITHHYFLNYFVIVRIHGRESDLPDDGWGSGSGRGRDGLDWARDLSNALNGFCDAMTFGAVSKITGMTPGGGQLNTNSDAYFWGSVTGAAYGLAMGPAAKAGGYFGGRSTTLTKLPQRGAEVNRGVDMSMKQFGRNLTKQGYSSQAHPNGNGAISYTSGNRSYTTYPHSTSTGGPSAVGRVGGVPKVKYRFNR